MINAGRPSGLAASSASSASSTSSTSGESARAAGPLKPGARATGAAWTGHADCLANIVALQTLNVKGAQNNQAGARRGKAKQSGGRARCVPAARGRAGPRRKRSAQELGLLVGLLAASITIICCQASWPLEPGRLPESDARAGQRLWQRRARSTPIDHHRGGGGAAETAPGAHQRLAARPLDEESRRLADERRDSASVIKGFASAAPRPGRLARRDEPAAGQQAPAHQAPKLVQWSKEPVHYFEGSTLVLSCSLAAALAPGSQVRFTWLKHPAAPGSPMGGSNGKLSSSLQQQQQHHAHHQQRQEQLHPAKPTLAGRLVIETLAEYSFLRLANLSLADAGAYQCVASNSAGQEDRTTAQVLVNVKLKWLQTGPSEPAGGAGVAEPDGSPAPAHHRAGSEPETARAGQPAAFECAAAAQPRPHVRWFRLVPAVGVPGPAGRPAHHQGAPAASRQLAASMAARLDEAQVRVGLTQLGLSAGPEAASAYQRVPIFASRPDDHMMADGLNASRWRVETSLGGAAHEIRSRLVVDRAEPALSGLYECEASPADSVAPPGALDSDHPGPGQPAAGDRLRKLFGLVVNGK